MDDLVLGTALWGWTVDDRTAFALLDQFYKAGGRKIDSAANYPINKNPDDFRRAEMMIKNWITAHGVKDLKIIMKIGSVNNDGGDDQDLSESAIQRACNEYQAMFGSHLNCLMVHWDKRNDQEAIAKSCDALRDCLQQGLTIGLSGIKCPEFYFNAAPDLADQWMIEIKHNIFSQEAYSHYKVFHGVKRFYAYGINAGGLKLNENRSENSSAAVRSIKAQDMPPVEAFLKTLGHEAAAPANFNQLGLLFARCNRDIAGVILGPSKIAQLQESLNYWKMLKENDGVVSYLCQLVQSSEIVTSGPH